jgi:DNA replication protein DnaC
MRQRSQIITKQSTIINDDEYNYNAQMVKAIGDILLSPQHKEFLIDEKNKETLKFLLLYFKGCKSCEDVFEGKGYKMSKQLLICGDKGTGKTLLGLIFEEYLRRTKNPMQYKNVSVTQMMNHYQINNNLDAYTYNEIGSGKFDGKPHNIFLNDLGLETHKHFGTDTKKYIEDFMHARNEIFTQQGKMCHITTNLSPTELVTLFNDKYDRLTDRLKTYNIIPLTGDSRR